jgi:hypothetical protein
VRPRVRDLSKHRGLLLVSSAVFVICAATVIYLLLENETIVQARNAEEALSSVNSTQQPISFFPHPGEYNTCSTDTGTPQKLGETAAAAPTPTASVPQDAIPKHVTVGQVIQVTVVFGCVFNASAVAKMRDNGEQFKPEIYALDFDVEDIMAGELAGRDFYCVTAATDPVCANGSTTPVQDLKWTWFLRPRSVGQHLVRLDVYQRRIVGRGSYVEVAPRWVKEYLVDVRQPFTDSLAQWATVIAALAALFPAITLVQGVVAWRQQRKANAAGGTTPTA